MSKKNKTKFYKIIIPMLIVVILAPLLRPFTVKASGLPDLVLNDQIIGNGQVYNFQADNSITANNFIIENGGKANFQAGQKIKLNSGFKSKLGSRFSTRSFITDDTTNPYIPPTSSDSTPDSLPSIKGDLVGYIAGSFSVNKSGASNYNIPLAVSPGTSGMEPKLALNYNSRGGNGIMGMGWSLVGLSAIGRCPTNQAQDGFIDEVNFDSNDKLCLNGQRLIAISGQYGANGIEYRTEIESFSRVIGYNNFNSNNAWFKVWTKSGLIHEYGNTPDSRIEAQGKIRALSWNVAKISDTSGNYLTITYEENNTNGESYPSRINYTGNSNILIPYNSVRFVYENRSSDDITPQYVGGSLIKTTKRLKKIQTYSQENLTREYRLNYNNTSKTKKSHLISLTECSGSGICFGPTTFEWEQGYESIALPENSEFINSDICSNKSSDCDNWDNHYSMQYPDINGDGKADLCYRSDAGIQCSLSVGDGFVNAISTNICKYGSQDYGRCNDGDNTETISYPDINGDGRADLCYRSDAKGVVCFNNIGYTSRLARGMFYRFDTDNPIYTNICANGTSNCNDGDNHYSLQYPDINGDGKADLCYRGDSGIKCHLNTGNSFDASKYFTDTICNNSSRNYGTCNDGDNYNSIRYPDINGDGKADLCYRSDNSGVVCFQSTGSKFNTTNYISTGICNNGGGDCNDGDNHSTIQYPDINADGKADLCYRSDLGIRCRLNTGDGFNYRHPSIYGFNGEYITTNICRNSATEYGVCNDGDNYYSIQYPDINSDGKADLVYRSDRGIETFLSNGAGFINYTSTDICKNNSNEYGICNDEDNYKTIKYVDVNGDGRSDLVYRSDKGIRVVSEKKSIPDIVTKITTGHGAVTNIKYKAISDTNSYRGDVLISEDTYSKGDTAIYPYRDIQIPMYVVSEYTSSNGIGGTSKISYKYAGLKVHQQGRGMTAFSNIEIKNHQTGTIARTYYHQEYPFNGVAKKTEVFLNGILLTESTQDWQSINYGANRYFPYMAQAVVKQRELDNTLFSTITTTNQYDNYGNVTSIAVTSDDGHITTTNNVYVNNTSKWLLSRLTNSQVIVRSTGQVNLTRRSKFEYNSETGLLSKEFTDPGGAKELNKTYQRDKYGNITQTITNGVGILSRSESTTYDLKGRFVKTSTNALGHTETKNHNEYFGLVSNLTGPNDLTTSWQYDGFGRKILETRADKTQTRISRFKCDTSNPCPSGAIYLIRTDSSGNAPVIEYNDVLNRPIRNQAISFDGKKIFVDTVYNNKGQNYKVSDPYFEGDTALWNIYEYDGLGRVIKITTPNKQVIRTTYNGRTTKVTNLQGQTQSTIVNSQGKTIQSIDNDGNSNTFTYDSFGNLKQLKDSVNNIMSMTYDLLGNKTSITDPDTGLTTYRYNVLGELTSQTDANNNTMNMWYDKLGRLTRRSELEGITHWIYDTKSKGIGKLARIIAPNNYKEEYNYDTLGRLNQTDTIIKDEIFSSKVLFDQYSRVKNKIYPSNFATENIYNTYGYLVEVKNANQGDNTRYWKAENYNVKGQLQKQILGNNVVTEWNYNNSSGFLDSIFTHPNNSASAIQSLNYSFDSIGNLTNKKDNRQNISESFTYDSLNRLSGSTVAGQLTKKNIYDKIGNIIYRSGVGAYSYGSGTAGSHAVTNIVGAKPNVYTYDLAGNRINSINDGTVAYTSFNKPHTITKDNKSTSFVYGPNRSRYRQENKIDNNITSLITYIGGLYEREQIGSSTKYKHYVTGGGGVVIAIYTMEGDNTQTHYLHRDHLSSVDTITDQSGAVVERLSFDSWGMRRNSNWTDALNNINSELSRGFTGHEHLDQVSLIHMNGRVYDPIIGRFLSADPFVQAPENTQNLNRYSYVLNNPLNLVDPSGFNFWGDALIIVAVVTVTIATGGLAAGTLLGLNGFSYAVVAGAVGGFAGGFTGATLGGANFDQAMQIGGNSALIGGVSGGAFHVVGSAFGDVSFGSLKHGQKILAHGAVGGMMSMTQGGKFEHGFLSAGFVQAFASNIDTINSANTGIDPYRATVAAIVGGTATSLGGGKFANGAVTGAFSRMFNDEMHYDGKTIKHYNDEGKLIGEYLASSGKPGLKTSDQIIKNEGTIPEGGFTFNPDEISKAGFFRRFTGDWGKYRVPLHPDSNNNMYGRKNFFLHNGSFLGSKGCIDVGNNVKLFEQLKTHNGLIKLTVKY